MVALHYSLGHKASGLSIAENSKLVHYYLVKSQYYSKDDYIKSYILSLIIVTSKVIFRTPSFKLGARLFIA